MTALLQQLQHMLEAWDAADDVEKLPDGTERPEPNRISGKQKGLFITSVDCTTEEEKEDVERRSYTIGKGKGNTTGLNGGVVHNSGDGNSNNNDNNNNNSASAAVQAGEEYPMWLKEMERSGSNNNNNNNSNSNNNNNSDNTPKQHGDGSTTVVAAAALPNNTPVESSPTRDRITKLELARAALALFTSNAGIYRPVLRRTLGFLFGLIDELFETTRTITTTTGGGMGGPTAPMWSSAENEEVAATHERMRVMEARMAKLVEEASTQRDHLKAEIAAHEAREVKLEELLKHQIELLHMNVMPNDIALAAQSKKKDALYVRRLINRAEDEKAIDELQQEVESLHKERAELSRRVQDLLELNGKYAIQCIELSTRLSILSDHNIGIAVEGRKKQNEILLEKRRNDEHLRDLQTARNVVMAAFVNRQHAVEKWWSHLREQRLEKAAKTLLKISNDFNKNVSPLDKIKEVEAELKETETALDIQNMSSEKAATAANAIAACTDDEMLYHLWLTPAGNNPFTPEHLRSISSVEYLRTNPLVAERVIRMILSEWDKEEEREPLDVFTRSYLWKMSSSTDEEASSSSVESKKTLAAHNRSLQIAYALDAISRSGCCGSLTYAFGLVTRGKVNEYLFRMLEFDATLLFSICRFLDIERNSPGEPRGLIPVVQFACVLFAMYPSYPLFRLEQILNAARNDGGNRTQSPVLLHYTVLLPERMNTNSASASVENAGALWDTTFAHILYKCICDDVEESWQTVEDSFYTYAKRYGVASESQLMYKAFKNIPEEDARMWVPALRTALTNWSELKPEKASVVLEELPRVPVKEAVAYLRMQTIIRRGTRPMSSIDHTLFLSELQRQWDNFAGGHVKVDLVRYTGLVNRIDARRHVVWGCNASLTGDLFRHVELSERVTVRDLLERLQHEEEEVK